MQTDLTPAPPRNDFSLEFSSPFEEVARALIAASSQMGDVIKNAANTHFKNKYADLAAVVDAVQPALQSAGMTFIQGASVHFEEGVAYVCVTTVLLHTSGQWARNMLTLKPSKDDPQGIGSAITYGRRYGLQALCGVAPEDDDANRASLTPPPQQQPRGQAAQEQANRNAVERREDNAAYYEARERRIAQYREIRRLAEILADLGSLPKDEAERKGKMKAVLAKLTENGTRTDDISKAEPQELAAMIDLLNNFIAEKQWTTDNPGGCFVCKRPENELQTQGHDPGAHETPSPAPKEEGSPVDALPLDNEIPW